MSCLGASLPLKRSTARRVSNAAVAGIGRLHPSLESAIATDQRDVDVLLPLAVQGKPLSLTVHRSGPAGTIISLQGAGSSAGLLVPDIPVCGVGAVSCIEAGSTSIRLYKAVLHG